MSDEVGPTGSIEDCSRCYAKIPRAQPPRPPAPIVAAPVKQRKPRSKGAGEHCVFSHKGKVVHCYEDRSVAERVAAAFTKRGKAGTKFTVRDRSEDF